MKSKHAVSQLLKKDKFPKIADGKEYEDEEKNLQHEMLRIQQGVWHRKQRAILVFEGFDAAGKGGAIRRLTETLDPRGAIVHPIGPPLPSEQGRHWLYRFWMKLPEPGTIAIFDRSWYGRVLVERVEGFAKKEAWKRAYDEINQFEAMLVSDGVPLLKIFLAISKEEQYKRFEERLNDPYKNWKITEADVKARALWNQYVDAADDMFHLTDSQAAPWRLIAADDKRYVRLQVMREVAAHFKEHADWMRREAAKKKRQDLAKALQQLAL